MSALSVVPPKCCCSTGFVSTDDTKIPSVASYVTVLLRGHGNNSPSGRATISSVGGVGPESVAGWPVSSLLGFCVF